MLPEGGSQTPSSPLGATPRLIFLLVGSDGALDVKQSIMQYVFLADSVPRELADKIVPTISYAPGITRARLYSDEFHSTPTCIYRPPADALHLLSVWLHMDDVCVSVYIINAEFYDG